jgi:hypothetical protein
MSSTFSIIQSRVPPTREVLIEKTFFVKIKTDVSPINGSSFAWYFEGQYANEHFLVRYSTKSEYRHMLLSKIFGDGFKSRCSKKGFYIIVEPERFEGMFIGKYDSFVVKK